MLVFSFGLNERCFSSIVAYDSSGGGDQMMGQLFLLLLLLLYSADCLASLELSNTSSSIDTLLALPFFFFFFFFFFVRLGGGGKGGGGGGGGWSVCVRMYNPFFHSTRRRRLDRTSFFFLLNFPIELAPCALMRLYHCDNGLPTCLPVLSMDW